MGLRAMFKNILNKYLAEIEGNKLTAFDLIALRNGVPPKRLDEFWKYCFGSDYKNLKTQELPTRWNNLHSDYMIISSKNTVYESIKLMAAIFITK